MEKIMYTADDVMKICNCSKAKAYNIIKGMNDLLIKQGASKNTVISGKISIKFFNETMKI